MGMIQEKQPVDFEQIYIAYFSKMKHFAKEYVLSDEDAENIVQDVFGELWERKEILELPINIIAYLFTAIKNRCVDFLRRKILIKDIEDKLQEEYRLTLQAKYYSLEHLDLDILEEESIEQILSKAIDALPEKCGKFLLKIKSRVKSKKRLLQN